MRLTLAFFFVFLAYTPGPLASSIPCVSDQTIRIAVQGTQDGTWGRKFQERLLEQILFPLCDGRWIDSRSGRVAKIPGCFFQDVQIDVADGMGELFFFQATLEPRDREKLDEFTSSLKKLEADGVFENRVHVQSVLSFRHDWDFDFLARDASDSIEENRKSYPGLPTTSKSICESLRKYSAAYRSFKSSDQSQFTDYLKTSLPEDVQKIVIEEELPKSKEVNLGIRGEIFFKNGEVESFDGPSIIRQWP